MLNLKLYNLANYKRAFKLLINNLKYTRYLKFEIYILIIYNYVNELNYNI